MRRLTGATESRGSNTIRPSFVVKNEPRTSWSNTREALASGKARKFELRELVGPEPKNQARFLTESAKDLRLLDALGVDPARRAPSLVRPPAPAPQPREMPESEFPSASEFPAGKASGEALRRVGERRAGELCVDCVGGSEM